MRVQYLLVPIFVFSVALVAAGQPLGSTGIMDSYRPRVAVAADGSFAVAWEALVPIGVADRTQWQIAVQRFAASGAPVGDRVLLAPESCGGFDIWSSDFLEHVELAFTPGGTLLVLMTHTGWFSLAGVDEIWTSEANLAALDANGQVIDLHDAEHCVLHKLIFPGGNTQEYPRLAVRTDGTIWITQEGSFDDDDAFGDAVWRNVAIRVLSADGGELIEQVVLHDDPASHSAAHRSPDIAAGGDLVLSVWHECPIVDNQGNANECGIGAQFVTVQNGALQAVGGNVSVSTGAPGGAFSVYPSAAMNASGSSIVVWIDTRTRPEGEVVGQRFDAGGTAVGTNFQVSTGQGEIYSRPEVALLDDGQFMVVWGDSSAAGFRARGRRFAADAAPLEPPVELSSEGGLWTGQPAVSTAGGDYFYAWMEGDETSRQVFTSRIDQGVSTEPRGPLQQPAVALDGYPNPFYAQVTLSYDLPTPGHVIIDVHDLLGRVVRRLVNQWQPAGTYVAQMDGLGLEAGSYVVRLRHGGQTRTLLLARLSHQRN